MPFISAAITAIGSALTSVGSFFAAVSATTIGSFIVKTLSYVATNMLVSAILGKPKTSRPPFSIRGKMRAGEDVPRSIIFGKTATAGSLTYANAYNAGSTPRGWQVWVIALSDLPVTSLAQMFVNGEAVTLSGDPSAGFVDVSQYVKSGTSHIQVRFYDGSQTSADSFMTSTFGSDPNYPYTSNMVGYGVAYAIVRARINQELFSGFPEFRFELNGIKLYDPSKDDTVGGSGPQRWATPATWGGDGDHLPMVQLYNVFRGITYGGTWFYGLQGMSEFRLPAAAWIAEIEKCRALITEASGQVATYRSGAELEVDTEIGDACEAILTACAGRAAEAGGILKPLAGAVGSSVKSFTDADIISTDAQTFTPFPGLSETVNGIMARYPDPTEAYSLKDAPPLFDSDAETQDGGFRLISNVTLPNVPYAEQVQRLMKWAMAEARRQRRHTIVVPPDFMVLEPNDVVTWSSARNGYSNKLFRIEGVVLSVNALVVLDLVEVDAADYAWNTGTDFTAVTSTPIVPVRPATLSVVGFSVAPVAIQTGGAVTQRVGLKMQWSTSGIVDVVGIRFEIRNQTTQVVVASPETHNFSLGELTWEQNLIANETYEVRAIYISYSARSLSWTSWSSVTTTLSLTQPGVPTLSEALYATRDGTAVRVLINADWSPSPEAYEYQVEARRSITEKGIATGDAFQTYGRTDQNMFQIRDVTPGTWEVRVKGLSVQQVPSAYSIKTIIISGLGAPPKQLQNLSLQTSGGLAVIKWSLSEDLDVRIGGRIVIRHSDSTTPTWANSVSMDEVDGNNTLAIVQLKPGTYLVRPRDNSGNLGPVATKQTKGAMALTFTPSSTLQAHTAWSGTKTNTTVNGVSLELTDVDNAFSQPEDLTHADWTKTNVTISANVDTYPGAGSATADKIVETAATGEHKVSADGVVIFTQYYTVQVYAKADGQDELRISLDATHFGAGAYADFDFTQNTVVANAGTAEIFDEGGGWYRCEYTALAIATGTATATLALLDAGATSYAGNTSNGVIIGKAVVRLRDGGLAGLYEFASGMDLTTVKNVRLRSIIDLTANNLTSTIDDRTELIDTWADFDDTDGAYVDCIVMARKTDDDPAGSPTWTSWARLDADEDAFRAAEFRAILITNSSDFNVLLAELSVTAEEVT